VKLAGKITDGKKTVLEKAKAIYDWTCVNTYRDPKTRGCGEGNICNLLANPGGKCADIHSVFVALHGARSGS
jgi:transglutaminase-like putative cysteine protease